jgi:hypothetical protein
MATSAEGQKLLSTRLLIKQHFVHPPGAQISLQGEVVIIALLKCLPCIFLFPWTNKFLIH